jgi:hypothetical protein
VTNFRNCLDTTTNDVTSTIWTSMTTLVANAAQNVVLSLGCELATTGVSDLPNTSQSAPGQQCTNQSASPPNKGLLSPDLTGTYFSQYYQRAAIVAALVAMAVGMAAAAFFAVTRNGVRLVYAAIGYPGLVAIGIIAAPGLLATVLRLTDDLGFYVAGPVQISNYLQNVAGIYQMPGPSGAAIGGTAPPVFVTMVTSLAVVVFGIVAIIELLARSVAIYLVVLFWPLALASSAWGGGFAFARRFLRVILAVVVAKPVMVIVVSLGVGLITTAPLDLISMVEGVMLLLLALLAPLVPFALFGGAEAAVSGQLQVRERLSQAAGQAAPAEPAPAASSPATATSAAAAVAPVRATARRSLLRKSTDGSVGAS